MRLRIYETITIRELGAVKDKFDAHIISFRLTVMQRI